MSILCSLVNRDMALYWKYQPSGLAQNGSALIKQWHLNLISMCSKTTWNYRRQHWKNVLFFLPHDFGKHNVVSERPYISGQLQMRAVWAVAWRRKTVPGKEQWSQRLFYYMPWPTTIQKQSLHSIRIFALWVETLGWSHDGLQDNSKSLFSHSTWETMCSPLLITILYLSGASTASR